MKLFPEAIRDKHNGNHNQMALTKKQKQHRQILVGIILIVGAIFLINALGGGGKFFAVAGVPSDLTSETGKCIGGFTPLSVSPVNIGINDESGKDMIRVSGLAKGSECMKLTLNKNSLNTALKEEGYTATQDVFLTTKLTSFSQTFPIRKSGDYLGVGTNKVIDKSGRYGQIDANNKCNPSMSSKTAYRDCLINWCKTTAQEPLTIFAYKVDLSSKVRCVLSQDYGDYGIVSGEVNSDFNVDITIGSETKSLNRGTQSTSFSDGHFVQFGGTINELDGLPSIKYDDATLVGSKWELIGGNLELYNAQLSNFKTNMDTQMMSTRWISDGRFDTLKTGFSDSTKFINEYKTQEYESFLKESGLIFDATTDKNNFYVSLKAKQIPVLVFDLNAEKVGIIRLQGQPEITDCVDKQELLSGINKGVTFSVKNKADVDNVEFYGNVQCDGGVVATFPSFQIDGQETKTINMQLQPTNLNQDALNGNCIITVKDKGSGNSNTCEFSTEVEYNSGRSCEPNSLFCQNKDVYKCNSDGKDWSLSQSCSTGCETYSGGARCIKGGAKEICDNKIDDDSDDLIDLKDPDCQEGACIPEGQTIVKDQECCETLEKKKTGFFLFRFLKSEGTCVKTLPECNNANEWALSKSLGEIFPNLKCDGTTGQKVVFVPTLIRLILIPIAFLFSLVFGNSIFRRLFKEKNKVLAWIFSFIVAGLIAYLLYVSFWLGLILAGVYLVIKAVIGATPLGRISRMGR